MKKTYTTLFILVSVFLATTNSLSGFSLENLKSEDTLLHDMQLVKPTINFNEPNGGFYSEYIDVSLNTIFYGAVVQNVGQVSSTEVFLEIKVLEGYSENVLDTYYSDTINVLEPLEIDTIQFERSFITWNKAIPIGEFKIIYLLKSNLIEDDLSNNTDTLSFELFHPDWVNVSRSTTPTGSLDIETLGFSNFIGTTLKLKNHIHQIVRMEVELPNVWNNNGGLVAHIYENQKLLISIPFTIYPDNYASADFYLSGCLHNLLYPDSLYYFGISIENIATKELGLSIGIDTSNFHNFEYESIANIDGTWTTLDFVPAIRLVFDPEGIPEHKNSINFNLFPNPVNQTLYLTQVANSSITILNMLGQVIHQDFSINETWNLDVSHFNNGQYLVKVANQNGYGFKKMVITH
ncbi:MAG: hypothetical protein A2W95_08345 [Bacteroidetes bacterium GWA2_40_14]|nr:MAG: hypothetical protein A2W95_08345 [Bacteroidetes bacterium GWA2_40_14]